ncbi:MAG: ABC transporter permease [Bacteroidota bacterium]
MKVYDPPAWADRLIARFCQDSKLEEIQGDLHEAFHWRCEERGPTVAMWLFIYEALRVIRPDLSTPLRNVKNYIIMYKIYLRTGWRFLIKHKFYSVLNILGLALGISFCWLAYLYTHDEISYNRHIADHETLFRIVADFKPSDKTHYIGGSSNAMSLKYEEEIPEIDQLIRFKSSYGMIKKEEETLPQEFLYADKELIDALNLSTIEGNLAQLNQPNDLILSESLAAKLNIRGKAIGHIMSIADENGEMNFIVRGVYRDIPHNTSIRSDMIISFAAYESVATERSLTTWFNINMNSLIKIHDVDSRTLVEEKMTDIHYQNTKQEAETFIKLQPISQIHLDETYGHYNGISGAANVEMMRVFLIIGLFCLIISIINYSNFTVSLYIHRAREIGLRKVIGAGRSGIFSQLITESFLSCFLASILALGMLVILLPQFSGFIGKDYSLEVLINQRFLIGAGAIILLTSFLSGAYPALVLSRFSILKSLKGEQKIKSGKWITQGLLTLQFMIATGLIAGVFTMQKQVNHMANFDTKINYDNVIMIRTPTSEAKLLQFVNDLKAIPDIVEVAAISGYNGTGIEMTDQRVEVAHLRFEGDLLNMLDIGVTEGRSFDPNLGSDRVDKVMVNQKLVKALGLENPIGTSIPFDYGELKNPTIIGVVEDYLYTSAKTQVKPLVIYLSPQYQLNQVFVKLNSSALFDESFFAGIWSDYFDPYPFQFRYLESRYKDAFRAEQLLINLVGTGCGVAIFLATIGLLGMVGLQLGLRLKEVSIRKVLGADNSSLYRLFTSRYLVVISIGLLGGLTISYLSVSNWLESYAYRIDVGILIFVSTIAIVLTIGLSTIIGQINRVLRANSVTFLRSE